MGSGTTRSSSARSKLISPAVGNHGPSATPRRGIGRSLLTTRPRSRTGGDGLRYSNLLSAAQWVSWWRDDICSLRSTAEAWVSTVFTEMCSAWPISLYE